MYISEKDKTILHLKNDGDSNHVWIALVLGVVLVKTKQNPNLYETRTKK